MWRHHPQTTLARKLVADGAIGRLAYVRAALSVSVEPGDIRRSAELGGGALNDLGCYCVSGIRLIRRDELELVGTEGRLTVADPWLCRSGHLELTRDGRRETIPVDPDGAFALTDPDHDVYRVELDTVSAALAAGAELPFGRPDAVAQATALEALHRSAELATPVNLSHGRSGRR
jgi:predicted dehydrogenase